MAARRRRRPGQYVSGQVKRDSGGSRRESRRLNGHNESVCCFPKSLVAANAEGGGDRCPPKEYWPGKVLREVKKQVPGGISEMLNRREDSGM